MIPTFRSTTEQAVWAGLYLRHLSGGATEAWKLADRGLEDWRDEEQRRCIDERIESEEGPAHV